MARTRRRISDDELNALRAIPLTEALDRLGIRWKGDQEFHPRKDKSSRRITVDIGVDSWEIVFTGMKWQDTRTKKGGGGAIDLVMYLLNVEFLEAVGRLTGKVK